MFPSTYMLGNQTNTASTSTSTSASTTTLRRETTDDISKKFTTLHDGDNNDNNNISCSSSPLSALDALGHFYTNTTTTILNPSSVTTAMPWNTTQYTPISPVSPTLSYFSSSANGTDTDSAFTSPNTYFSPYDNFSADTSLDASMMFSLEGDSIDSISSDDLFSGIQTKGDLFPGTTAEENATVVAPTSVSPLGGFDYSTAEVAPFLHKHQEKQQYQHQHCNAERDQGQQQGEKLHHTNKEALHISENNVSCNGYGSSSRNATSTGAKTKGATGGPTRRSRLTSFAPYPSTSSSSTSTGLSGASISLNQNHSRHRLKNKNNNSNSNNYCAMWQQQDAFESEQLQYEPKEQDDTNNQIEQDYDNDNDNDDVMSTWSSSSSLSSAPSSRCSSPETSVPISVSTSSSAPAPTAPLRIPGTEGMTTIHQHDGSIACFNPTTSTCIFFCALCLAANSPTSSSSSPSYSYQQSFGRIHDLRRHQRTKHPEAANIYGGGAPKVWPCEFCEKPFTRRDALLRHYTVKAVRDDGVHPTNEQKDLLDACRVRAKST
ncbi:hypothetical protein BGZ95_011907 [Linnemannia exigua]|uniref:C2H2-type domain-containing protein n=1 Tax=Linnemannia exigua TaxID=604196 RepID=A0AAD4D9R3_9FUNG|nr:hypothetical protein BGZ95_011907 [Linnemannia exigua]